MDAVSKLVLTAIKAYSINPAIHFEVFIHKVSQLDVVDWYRSWIKLL